MANTAWSRIGDGVRRIRIDTTATDLDLGVAAPGRVGRFVIYLYSNSATGNGITVAKRLLGSDSLSLAFVASTYYADETAVAAATKITNAGRYVLLSDAQEEARLSFEITSGSWDVVVASGPG